MASKKKSNKVSKIYPLERSPLFKLSNKRRLESIIGLERYSLNKIREHIDYYTFEIDKRDGEKRPITAPNFHLKRVQKSIHDLLSRIDKPDWLISGSKGKSYIDNAKLHQRNQSKYALTLDIKKFYPRCTRGYVFSFLSNTLEMSDDVAGVMADVLTLKSEIPTGSPASQLLAFFAYKEMFIKLNELALRYDCVFTVYVDDLSFSSQSPFDNYALMNDVESILEKYGHKLKRNKKAYYSKSDGKMFTGVVLDAQSQLKVPNNLQAKIKKDADLLMKPETLTSVERQKLKNRLQGRIMSARNIEPNKFPRLLEAVKVLQV